MLLVVLFVLAVLGITGAASFVAHLVLEFHQDRRETISENHWSLVATAGICTLGIIIVASSYRLAQLSEGGRKVAEALGGRLVGANSNDPLERRAVHVVEEMAIAAGLPVPPVYILMTEQGINAFAAGWSHEDAVIGLTQGALDKLSREQLQGVIAHEFSHILHRDCALNMRLLGALYGILVLSVLGRTLARFGGRGGYGSRRGWPAQVVVVGGVLWVLGSLGAFVARLIQAAVSRQREFLADASAVQFTRNPSGIAGALATIGAGSSELGSPHALEASHMLLGNPGRSSWLRWTASHPPLPERIRRVLPGWDGSFSSIAAAGGRTARMSEQVESGARGAIDSALGFSGGGEGSSVLDAAQGVVSEMPGSLRQAAEEPFSARALILLMVSFRWGSFNDVEPALAAEMQRLRRELNGLPRSHRLPLLDIALGSLAQLSFAQREALAASVEKRLTELPKAAYRNYCFGTITLRRLVKKRRQRRRLLIKQSLEIVLSVIAHEGHANEERAQAAFADGVGELGSRGRSLRLLPGDEHDVFLFDAALQSLLRVRMGTRTNVLQAAERIARYDGVIRPEEEELLRTMASSLGVGVTPE